MDIPVFHDDQHGTAIVVLAGVINALKVINKDKENCKVVVNAGDYAGCNECRISRCSGTSSKKKYLM